MSVRGTEIAEGVASGEGRAKFFLTFSEVKFSKVEYAVVENFFTKNIYIQNIIGPNEMCPGYFLLHTTSLIVYNNHALIMF